MKHLFSSFLAFVRSNPRDTIIMLLFIIAITVLIRLHLKTQIDENWDQFIVDHHCKTIKKEGANNQRRGWVCDDGEEYFRWRQQL